MQAGTGFYLYGSLRPHSRHARAARVRHRPPHVLQFRATGSGLCCPWRLHSHMLEQHAYFLDTSISRRVVQRGPACVALCVDIRTMLE